uniref:Uncharacterized protein n=1 Tax=Ditylenchus dipsaci TaxID=166011 RepID=A0A915EK94_9BILA
MHWRMQSVKDEVSIKVAELKANGGGLTMDFAKNQVDYIAVTAHYINSYLQKINFVLVFAPLPSGLKKTSKNVKALITSEMNALGISSSDMSKRKQTSTMNTALSEDIKEACKEIKLAMKCIEKLMGN